MPRSVVSRRAALLAVLALPLADVRALRAAPGHLTIPLDQWRDLTFTFEGEKKVFTTAELFGILKEGQ